MMRFCIALMFHGAGYVQYCTIQVHKVHEGVTSGEFQAELRIISIVMEVS